MLNIIEEQTIVMYVASPSQGMSWKVHFEFAYGHIKTHPYSPCKSKDEFFLVNFFCSNTWTFLIRCFSHNKILAWFLVHNIFILFYLGLWFNAIPSYCWHYGGWPKCNSPLCLLIWCNIFIFLPLWWLAQCNTLINCTKFCTSKGSSSNSRWEWKCEWMGS